jgi:uncharacterized protein (TIGR03546 family)
MVFLLKQIFNFLKLLNSDKGTHQIAAGVVCGMILGFTPSFSLQTLLVLFLVFIFRIQIGAVFTTAFFFKIGSFLLDPLFHSVGAWVLERPELKDLFTKMYNLPLVPLTRFYNSIVMGAAAVSLALAIPLFFIARYLIQTYRAQIVARFESTRYWKAFKATSVYLWYEKYDQLRG